MDYHWGCVALIIIIIDGLLISFKTNSGHVFIIYSAFLRLTAHYLTHVVSGLMDKWTKGYLIAEMFKSPISHPSVIDRLFEALLDGFTCKKCH